MADKRGAEKPILVFQTDFTYAEGAVSSMYGVVKRVDRELEIFDGTHYIPQYDIWSASYRLLQSLEFWPEGTIYVSVVDPGVGTARRACVAKTASGHVVVTPDNGTLTHLARYVGIVEVREIDETVNRYPGTRGTSVFAGRDVFGYTAARLASGVISWEEVGPSYSVDDIVRLPMAEPAVADGVVSGIVDIIDPNFGNARFVRTYLHDSLNAQLERFDREYGEGEPPVEELDLLAGEYEMETLVGPVSILLASALNLGTSMIVGWMIARKNRHINMVEALKVAQ